jgi:flagellar FliL protein
MNMAKDPKAKDAHGGDAAPAGNPKKKLIIIIAAVVILAAGGGGAWFFMKSKEDAKKAAAKKKAAHTEEVADGEHADEEHAEEEDEEHAEEDGGHPPAPPVFITLETFTVNLQPDPDEKFLQLDISLQVKTAPEADALKGQMPAIRDRILLLLSSKQASQINTLEGKQALSKELLEEINKPFKPHGKKQKVKGVFFTSFVIQ